jgi:hypothetical protein
MIEDRAAALLKFALQLWPRPVDSVRDSVEAVKGARASFHPDCVRLVQDRLQIQLSKLSQTKYESGTGGIRMVCVVSGEPEDASGVTYYWFGFSPNQLDFLRDSENPFICIGCGSSIDTLLVPLGALEGCLGSVSVTKKGSTETVVHWNLVIQRKSNRFVLKLLGGVDGPDLTEYVLSAVRPLN